MNTGGRRRGKVLGDIGRTSIYGWTCQYERVAEAARDLCDASVRERELRVPGRERRQVHRLGGLLVGRGAEAELPLAAGAPGEERVGQLF
jgi:hypothetical protein